MLEVKNVDVFYGDVQVLWDVSFNVQKGEIVALIGANGSGKTTCLNTVSSILNPRKGSVMYEGQPLHTRAPHEVVGRARVEWLALVHHGTLARVQDRRNRIQARRLAGAVRPDERDDLALLDVEAHVPEDLHVPVEHVDVLDLKHARLPDTLRSRSGRSRLLVACPRRSSRRSTCRRFAARST